MANKLHFNFLHSFDGVLWNTMHVPDTNLLILETRNETRREASFAALDFEHNRFVWKNTVFEEAWWIGMTAATSEVLLLHVYRHTENPDKKDLMAWHIHKQKKLWSITDFSFTSLAGNKVYGKRPETENTCVIDVNTGEVQENNAVEIQSSENIPNVKPFQYVEGTRYFETVKSFLMQKLNMLPTSVVEYLEYRSLIFISCYVNQEGLANYLIVLTADGTVVLQEKLGDRLKGIGLETFFILSGCLFFVRNKGALVSYRIV